jgi:hypothetical protein
MTVLSPGPSWLNSRKSRTTRFCLHEGESGWSVNPLHRLSSADPFIKKQSDETKVAVYKRIGQAILPDLFDLQPGVVADRVKSKIER